MNRKLLFLFLSADLFQTLSPDNILKTPNIESTKTYRYKQNNVENKNTIDSKEMNKSGFDFIFVGSGPSGSLGAVRLAQKGFRVLLIEAGPNHISTNITTPAFHLNADEDHKISWDMQVQHYPTESGLRQNVFYPRASALGGCTLHNALIHVYPNKEDFDFMVNLTNDNSWSETNMRKYFTEMTGTQDKIREFSPFRIASELPILGKLSGYLTRAISSISSNAGWLPLSTFKAKNVLSFDTKLIDIVTQILLEPIANHVLTGVNINGKIGGKLVNSEQGGFLLPMNIDPKNYNRKGVREHVLSVSKENKNLIIWTETLVTKIILSKDKKKAIGVQFKRGKYLYKASPLSYNTDNAWNSAPFEEILAKKEIIISGGTYNTPQLMMLSGIGHRDELRSLGIKPKIHLPGVGKNMQDRYEISLNFKFPTPFKVLEPCKFTNDDECFREFEKGNGGYTFDGLVSGSIVKSNQSLKQSDVFTISGPVYFVGYRKGANRDVAKYKNAFTFYILKAHTKNTNGYVKLKSLDPRVPPTIQFNYFSQNAESDIKPIIQEIRQSRKQAAKFPSGLIEINPGVEYQSDKDLEEYIRKTSWGHHACCTMKIGADNDNMAVLDGNFRVRKVKNLRVVDMSVFNKIPGYFPVVYLYMIGYKAGDAIAADYGK